MRSPSLQSVSDKFFIFAVGCDLRPEGVIQQNVHATPVGLRDHCAPVIEGTVVMIEQGQIER